MDRDAVQLLFAFMAKRDMLFADRHMEDEAHCVALAEQVAGHLTSINEASHGPDLAGALRGMRAALLSFIDRSGPAARNFTRHSWPGADPFALALGELRGRIGLYIMIIAYQYNVEIPDELGHFLPPD
ncbi:hypothetical protein ACFQO7_11130 [Catellatospora aurea]|uniref:Uncharacterized protein n=1 Tax=Catellatospora aurea TaxID=1337874 RepID=A0ABW2GSX9_9ACTN